MSDVDKTIEAQCGMTLFGFPIVWNENIPVGEIVLADWLTYLTFKFKKKAEEYEAESERRDSGLA